MSAAYKPPAGPPPSAGSLAKYVLAYARASDLTESRVRAWISYMITADILERATATGQPTFVIKGGVALELRLRDRARATKDLDIALHHPNADLALTNVCIEISLQRACDGRRPAAACRMPLERVFHAALCSMQHKIARSAVKI